MLCKKCLVSGRVQGVFYRATCQRRAAIRRRAFTPR